jgi:hypothetical protein
MTTTSAKRWSARLPEAEPRLGSASDLLPHHGSALRNRGLVEFSARDLGGGRKMAWGTATDTGRAVLRQIRGR